MEDDEETGMDPYDPLVAPDPAAWLALDEQERMKWSRNIMCGKRSNCPTPRSTRRSTTIHTCREPDRGGRRFPGAVEGSPIDGARTGPDDAIHAIGSVVRHPSDVISGKVGGPD